MDSELKSKEKIEMSSTKSFGLVFSIFFLILSLINILEYEINFLFLSISILLFLITMLIPGLFFYPNIIWFKFGILLSKIISPVIMFLIYIITFLPIGLLLKMANKDLLKTKINKNNKSYWIKRNNDIQDLRNQF